MDPKPGDVVLAFVQYEGDTAGKIRPFWIFDVRPDGRWMGVPGYSQQVCASGELAWEVVILPDQGIGTASGLHKATRFDFRHFGVVPPMRQARIIGQLALKGCVLARATAALQQARSRKR